MGLAVAEAAEQRRKPGGPAPVQKCGHGGYQIFDLGNVLGS